MVRSMLEQIVNYRPLTPGLASSGQPDAVECAAIAAAGYQLVVNLGLHGTEYALPDEAGTVRALGMDYAQIPVVFGTPKHDDLRRFFAVMDAHRDCRIWVHCAANKRASVFVGLWLHLRRGLPRDAAFAVQRDIWQPDATWARFMVDALAAAPD